MRVAVLFIVAWVAFPFPAAGLGPDTSLSAASASFIGEDSFDYAGWSVASGGDVNNDGFEDILIGADNDEEGGSGAGQTYLILGKAGSWALDTSVEEAATASFTSPANATERPAPSPALSPRNEAVAASSTLASIAQPLAFPRIR